MTAADPATNPRLTAALEAADLGLRPIPVEPGGKKSLSRWKDYQHRAPTADEIEGWWRRWPAANVAVLTGTPGGVLVVDLDAHGGRLPDWPSNGDVLPTGYVAETPSGGRHFVCKHVPGVRNSAGVLAERVDVRGEGGYFLIPPSTVSGRPYRVLQGSLAEALETPCPPWLVAYLTNLGPTDTRAREPAAPVADTIPEGRRNATLASLAGSMRRRGAEEPEIEAALSAMNARRCRPPLADAEVRRIAASVARYPPARGEDFDPEPDDGDGGQGREARLGFLRKMLKGAPIQGAVQTGTEDPAFALVLADGRRVELGSAQALLSPARFQANLYNSHIFVSRPKRSKMDKIAKAVVEVAEIEKMPTSLDELREWLSEFAGPPGEPRPACSAIDPATAEGKRRLLSEVIRPHQGPTEAVYDDAAARRLWLPMKGLLYHVAMFEHAQVNRKDLAKRLRRLDFENVQLAARDEGRTLKARLWRSPPGFEP